MSVTAQWLGSPAVSLCSSIWYYLALIELSPPSLLPLPSSSPPFLYSQPGIEGWDRERQALFCVPASSLNKRHKLLVSWPGAKFSFSSVSFILLSTYHLCLQTSPLQPPLVIISFSSISPLLLPSFFFLPSLPHPLSHPLHRQFQFTSGS